MDEGGWGKSRCLPVARQNEIDQQEVAAQSHRLMVQPMKEAPSSLSAGSTSLLIGILRALKGELVSDTSGPTRTAVFEDFTRSQLLRGDWFPFLLSVSSSAGTSSWRHGLSPCSLRIQTDKKGQSKRSDEREGGRWKAKAAGARGG